MSNSVELLTQVQNKVVEIDGDKFWLTIPPVDLLYLMPQAFFDPDKALEMQFPEIAFSRFGTKNMDIITMPTYDTDIVFRIDMEKQKPMSGLHNENIYSYRPMLVPLAADLTPDLSFEKQNEPEALFHGGFLISTSEETQAAVVHGGGIKSYPSLHHIAKPHLSITLEAEDPGQCIPWFDMREPLAWMHIQGCLICTKPVAVIDFPLMRQHNLIPTERS